MPAVHPCEGIGSKDAGCQAEVVGQAEKIFYTREGGGSLIRKQVSRSWQGIPIRSSRNCQ